MLHEAESHSEFTELERYYSPASEDVTTCLRGTHPENTGRSSKRHLTNKKCKLATLTYKRVRMRVSRSLAGAIAKTRQVLSRRVKL
jgi:hypothetical protein